MRFVGVVVIPFCVLHIAMLSGLGPISDPIETIMCYDPFYLVKDNNVHVLVRFEITIFSGTVEKHVH